MVMVIIVGVVVFKIQKSGNMSQQIMKALLEVEKSTVEVGHFAEQGNHSTALKLNGSPYSYVELMHYHHTGDGGPRPPRQPLEVLKIQNRNLSQHRWMKSAVKKTVKELLNPQSQTKVLESIGRNIGRLEKDIFGDPALLAGTPYNTDPLIDTGELRSKVSHKNSRSGALKNA